MSGWHMRFPYGGSGRMLQGWVFTHAVHDDTLKSFCGRNAADWGKTDDGAKVDCKKCLKKLGHPPWSSV